MLNLYISFTEINLEQNLKDKTTFLSQKSLKAYYYIIIEAVSLPNCFWY